MVARSPRDVDLSAALQSVVLLLTRHCRVRVSDGRVVLPSTVASIVCVVQLLLGELRVACCSDMRHLSHFLGWGVAGISAFSAVLGGSQFATGFVSFLLALVRVVLGVAGSQEDPLRGVGALAGGSDSEVGHGVVVRGDGGCALVHAVQRDQFAVDHLGVRQTDSTIVHYILAFGCG